MTAQLTPVEILIGIAVLVVLVALRRASARAAKRAHDAAQVGTRVMSLASRVLLGAAVIVGVQWIAITHAENRAVLWAVLAVPALLAAYTVTKALTVTVETPRRKGGRR
ncbi:hypothetical protein LCD36_14190 [Saccharopolyspora sp. 6T]|uniref:hypothetical protein n=1 Tax=Saccharopolyspora sp. 6T TaxID=2877238 RepID=UPI001CD62824|nr:hypothetical protein [Saccharopolyspora sp. 6T]MCA1187584.1 hypothetical protein [Saccharopolyspora sp. 6T]